MPTTRTTTTRTTTKQSLEPVELRSRLKIRTFAYWEGKNYPRFPQSALLTTKNMIFCPKNCQFSVIDAYAKL
jgi:hypothetical protein